MTSKAPCPSASDWQRLLAGDLPETEQTSLSRHLEACPVCQQRLQDLAAGHQSWEALAGHLNEQRPGRSEMLAQLMEKLRDLQRDLATKDEREERETLSLDFLDPPAAPHQLGKLDHYEILDVIGRGGMGIIFKAVDPILHRLVAIKVMAPQLAVLPMARLRFLREAQAAAAVCHDHVVPIHVVAEMNGLPYLVMQFVAGASLQERPEKRGSLSLAEILRIGIQTALGLAAAHAQGLVHRDIKPANILLENGVERVKITDFGLARAGTDARITQSGVIVGTPQYMAPEQARGEVVDHRADLFSLGSVLYFMCTGQAPFQGESSLAVLRRVCDDTPPPITEINPNTPEWLAAIIARLQAKAPEDRFQSAAEVAEVLNQHLLQVQHGLSSPTFDSQSIVSADQVEALPVVVPEWVPSPPHRGRARKLVAVTGAIGLLGFLGAVGFVFRSAFVGSRPNPSEQREGELASVSSPAELEKEDLASQIRDKLAMYCYRCHGENGAMEGGFNYLMDRDQLVARKKIRPEQPEKSRLLRRVAEGEMPPEGEKPRPGPEDIALLQRWIAAGAPAFRPSPASRPFVADSEGTQSIRADLAKRNERDRRFTRYFTLTHLFNSGLSEDELQSYRNGLSKLLNSLSWEKTIAVPVPIDAAKTVLRIDLRDYGWTDTEWEALLIVYPYRIDPLLPEHSEEKASTGTALAHLRGDWFVAHASRPPLYHQLLQLPRNERELEKLLHINVEANIRSEKVARAGFNDSGVSRNNRLIERHKTSYGAYWKSYDFAKNTGEQNLFERPLGPGSDEHSFRHAGGEIIFNLPNGLQGYMLVNGNGERIDKGPIDIVSDPKRPDRTVENGLSCMSCHSRGLNPKNDQIRAHVLANVGAFANKEERETILALYPPAEVFAELLSKDTERFQKASAATGAKVGVTEPIMALAAQFEAPLDLRRAAAEVGLTPADFLANLEQSPEIGRAIGALKIDGGTVQRQTFVRVLTELHGKPPPNRTSTQAKDQADGKIYPRVPTQPVDPVKFHRIEQAAPVAFKPYLPAAESEVVTLPSAVADVAVGGGGRYLVFRMERSLAVFDVQEGKLVRQLPLAEEHAHFAAGATRLVVLYPGARVLQIWDLTRFVKERSSPFPGSMATGEIRQVCMGSASNGPLFVYLANEKRTLALNPATLETTEVRWQHWGPKNAYGPLHMRAAPDGATLVGWSGGWSGAEMAFFREGIQHGSDNNIEFSMGLFALPSADGRRLFTPWAIVNRDGGPIKPRELANTYRVPAHEPGFFIALHSQGQYPHAPREKEPTARLPAVSQVVVYTDDGRRLFPLAGIDGLKAGTGLFWERRVHYYARAGLLAVLIAPDRLLLRRVDLVKNLDKTGADYIVVVSQPPLAHPGSTWSYQLDVRAKAGAGKVALESGPEGLVVTPGGRMTWRVPDDYPNPAAAVKLRLRDAKGLEMLQQFSVLVAPAKH